MRTREHFVVFTAAVALAGGLAMAPAAEAVPTQRTTPEAPTAQQAPPGCPDEALCVYDRPDYRGRMKHLYGSNNNLRQYGGVFNRAMSVYNNSEYCVQYIYKETYRRGAPKIIPRQQGRNLGAPTRVWSNQREHCQA